jgi:hypothetical protein
MHCSTFPRENSALVHGISRLEVDTPTASLNALPCPRCGAIDQPGIGPRRGQYSASARCQHCQAFIKWLSQYSPAERAARRQQARLAAMAQRPPSQLQLAYLHTLGSSGPPPAHMPAASEWIDALLKREVRV